MAKTTYETKVDEMLAMMRGIFDTLRPPAALFRISLHRPEEFEAIPVGSRVHDWTIWSNPVLAPAGLGKKRYMRRAYLCCCICGEIRFVYEFQLKEQGAISQGCGCRVPQHRAATRKRRSKEAHGGQNQ